MMDENITVNRVNGLKEAVKYGRLMGYVLQEYSSLKGSPDIELSTKDFKTWLFNCDGYDIQFYFNSVETDYFQDQKNIIETLQIWSQDLYFLPFIVSFKIAVAFFGNENVILTQILTPNKFIYCWNKMYDEEGASLAPKKGSCIDKSFLGHNYYLIKDIPAFIE
jgi:hypothetical protein